jgi:type IV pilus assembly protein PilC
MIQAYYLIRFSRYTKILLESGINYRNIFKMLKNVISNPIFTPLFDKTIAGLERGQGIYDCIKDDTKLIPSTVSALIKVGEKTATLSHTFETVISIYQEDLDNYITNLSKLIEPIMLVFIGGVVILIAL